MQSPPCKCVAQRQLQYSVNYLTASCCRGVSRGFSSSYRGVLVGGDGGSRVVGLLVRHHCSSLHRHTSLAPCLKAGLNKAIDSQSNSATLLTAMQTQLKCVTEKHRQFENFAGKAQVLSHKLYVLHISKHLCFPSWVRLMFFTLRRLRLDTRRQTRHRHVTPCSNDAS